MAVNVEDRLESLESRIAIVEERLTNGPRPRIGMSIKEAIEQLKHPVERGPEVIEQLRRLYGRFEGPSDLSERMRDYINGEHE